ncbi:M14 family metallopeptidase [Rhodoferax sp.]|uniref:M14 family metallopeptidase n=1 Tax=Rhodoferax sp. TaxID=50421 RepID=UPI0027736FB8|nr:M14 family metallopeptidase [Rhodoferax sp.]
MIGVAQSFAASYAQARTKFLEAAASAGVPVRSYVHPLKGCDGEELALDVALDGAADADRLLILSSACHGVEGFCGSGVQVHAMHDPAWRQHAREHGVAVLYLHALNPHGFSHRRRVTNENVDLNRNFQDFSGPLPANEAYRALHPLLLPTVWPPDAANTAAVSSFLEHQGIDAFQAAVSRGQHEFPDGLFFGGTEPTWSNHTVRQVLRDYARVAHHVAWIDLHTGLGPSGLGERIYAGRDDSEALQRARQWWDGGGATPITSIYDGSSSSAFLTGLMWMAIYQECPQAEFTGIAMEYGTQPLPQVMLALRADHWLHNHPQAPASLASQIHQKMMDAFYTDTEVWQAQVVSQARQSLHQAVLGLSTPEAAA